ncbi:MAG: inositol monophosphatase [Magnetovibrio sp.]|nr:inositol monophosphatase [Magnetovibrio sp.]
MALQKFSKWTRAGVRGSALLNVMIDSAGKAGRNLVRHFHEIESLQVSKKGPADFVTEADRRAEKILFETLSKARPNYGFLMEESGSISGHDISNRWIIDPLDGTLNFLHGLPHFAVSIAHERDGELFTGVIYEPVSDQMFWAERGKGAFLNGRRIRVSTRQDFSESLFSTGIPFKGRENHKPFIRQLEKMMAVSAGVRRFGAASLDLAYLATGRYDGFWEQGLSAWDIAAGILIVREAGGIVTDFANRSRHILEFGEVIASNGVLHNELQKLLSQN